MMLLQLRTTRVFSLSAQEQGVNLFSKAGSPTFALVAIFKNTADKTSSSVATPSVRTGSGWSGGSLVYLENSAVVTGATGT